MDPNIYFHSISSICIYYFPHNLHQLCGRYSLLLVKQLNWWKPGRKLHWSPSTASGMVRWMWRSIALAIHVQGLEKRISFLLIGNAVKQEIATNIVRTYPPTDHFFKELHGKLPMLDLRTCADCCSVAEQVWCYLPMWHRTQEVQRLNAAMHFAAQSSCIKCVPHIPENSLSN